MIERILQVLKAMKLEPNVILDIGSRDCLQSLEFAKHYKNAKIIAFECNPNTIPLCRSNISSTSNIELVEKAVNTYNGKCTFYAIDQEKTKTTWKDGNPGASSLFVSNGAYDVEHYVQNSMTVDCCRVDEVLAEKNIQDVDLVWIDLQGAEKLAFESFGESLERVKYIHTEVSYKAIYTNQVMFDELHSFLLAKGFENITIPSKQGWQEDVIYKNTRF